MHVGALLRAAEELKGDRESVLADLGYLSEDGHVLQNALQALTSDCEVVLRAVVHYGFPLEHAAEEVKADREVVLVAVSQDGRRLEYVAAELKHDRQIVLAAVTQNGRALEHAAEAVKGDREVVLVAVSQDGRALEHAASELKTDPDVILTAAAQCSEALTYAADALLQDEGFAADARECIFIFKITAISGRSCIICSVPDLFFADVPAKRTQDLLRESCRKLGLERTGREMLLSGTLVVPDGYLRATSPGCPSLGKMVEYQLVI